jgi:hypothetical protein
MTTNEPDDELERLLDRTLRQLPLRRAPAALASRVLGELERRAALPWWRREFARWPLAARTLFLVICGSLATLAFVGGSGMVAGLRSLHWSGALPLSSAHQVVVLVMSAGNLAAWLWHIVPAAWLYDGIAICSVLYVVLFGLGAAVYRTLYLQPLNGR